MIFRYHNKSKFTWLVFLLALAGLFIVSAGNAGAAAWMATGSYTGNGSSQSITGLGFQPEVVWIKADDATYSGAMSTSTMGSNKTKTLEGTGTLHSGSITSLDSDGFSVGSGNDVNADTVTYYWTAFDANSDMVVNSYTGDGSATQAISSVGFSPDYVIILGDNGTRAYNRTTYGGLYARRMTISGASTDAIISLDSDGFTAGDGSDESDGNMNASSVDYHYIAFNDAAGKIDVNFYPGNSTDNTNITGVGFQPEFVIIQEHLSSADMWFKSDQMSGDSALSNRGALNTDHIQAFISDGFQVGSKNNVNEEGKNYAYVAFNIITGGLIGHWEFDEGSGTNAADSVGSNDGTLEGPTNGLPAWTCVTGGYALTFDGDDDEVDLSNTTIGNRAAWTITAWIKMGADTAYQRTIYSEGDTLVDEYFTLYVDDTNNYVKFYSKNNSNVLTGTTNVEDNVWHLVTLVQRSTTDRELYVGVVSQDTDTIDIGTHSNNAAAIGTLKYIYGGVGAYDPADPFLGTIDDVRIYDRALSTAEISALAASPPAACGVTTTLADGADPANSTIAAGSINQYLDQFALTASTGTDSVTALTVTTANTSAIASVEIWNEAMTTQYFSTDSTPNGNLWEFSGGTSIPVTTSADSFRVVFTAKSHAALVAGTYAVTGTVTSFTSTNAQAGTDTDSATITVDNTTPGGTTTLYRSVGITATDLNTSSHTVEISGTTATFSGDMPTKVGVGDILQYPSSSPANLAVITGRTSATVFIVANHWGGSPTAASAGTAVDVFRAYTALNKWESQDENDSLDDALEDFDTSTDLTAATGSDSIMMVACYGDGEDTASVYIDSWTTGPGNYIKIYTPTSLSEVGTSQRHNGAWDTSAYRISMGGTYFAPIGIRERYVRIDGLQIDSNVEYNTESNGIHISDDNSDAAIEIHISNCIIRMTTSPLPATAFGLGLLNHFVGDNSLYVVKVWNNIIYGYESSGGGTCMYGDYNGTVYAYNNTCVGGSGSTKGITRYGSVDFYAKNNISIDATAPYSGTFNPGSTNNVSDANDAPGNAPINGNGVEPTFANKAGNNYHLSSSDTMAQGAGADLDEDTNLPITDDIDGDARDALAPEIGADELGADCGYTYKRKITIDGDKVGGSSGYLADFPLLVDLSDTWLKTAPTGDIQHANGWDIIFRGLDGTTCNGTAPCNLDFEVETYDGSAGKLVAWVRVPQVYAGDNDPGNDSVIHMYYGNSCVTDDPQNATGVWDSNYKGVWHHAEKYGLDFDGAASYVDSGYSTHHTQTTIEAWIYPQGWGEEDSGYEMGRVIDKREGGAQVLVLYLYNDTLTTNEEHLRFERVHDGHTGSWKTPDSSIALNTWQHIVVTYDESNPSNDPSIYINGQLQSLTEMEPPSGTPLTNTDDYIIGNRGAGDRTFDGIIDELRIYNKILTLAEVSERYQGKKEPSKDGLVIEYLMDEGSGNTVSDSSGNGHDGDMTGHVAAWIRPRAHESTANSNFGKRSTTMAAPEERINGCDPFDNEGVGVIDPGGSWEFADGGLDAGTSDFTISAWQLWSSTMTENDPTTVTKGGGNAADTGYWFHYAKDADNLNLGVSNGSARFNADSNLGLGINSDQWYYITVVFDREPTSDTAYFYLNGSPVGSENSALVAGDNVSNTKDVWFGSNSFIGNLDEVRISNAVRTADWIQTEFNNQTSPSTFFSLGDEATIVSFIGSGGASGDNTGASLSFDIGTAGTDRLIVIIADSESTGQDLTGVTVDGQACNYITTADNSLNGNNHQEMWYCDEDDLGSSNGSVTVAVSADAGYNWGVHVHLYTGVDQGGPQDFGIDDTSISSTTVTVTGIDAPSNGLVVMGAADGTGGLGVDTWTSPLEERANDDGWDPGGGVDLISASGIESSPQTDKTYTATFSGSFGRGTGIVAVWGAATGSNYAPTAPTTPYLNNTTAQSGQATPAAGITDPTPAFSAVFADPDSGDIANKYRIEVNTQSDFNGTEMWDSGASGSFMADTTAGSRSPDIIYSGSLLADSITYYWRITFWDDDGEEGAVSATQQFTTGTLSPIAIYYSVGTSTDDLKSGTPTMTIASRTATFSAAQPDNIGVGDVITYNTSLKAYISGRTSSTVYSVQTVTGGTPADVTDATVNSIKRAFNLLSAAESGSEDSSHLNTLDLVTGNYQLNWACYNDSAMDDEVDIDDWITGPSSYIRIFTPNDTSEVGTSQRHTGTAGTGFRIAQTIDLTSDNYQYAIRIRASANYTRIEGIEIDGSGWTNGGRVYGIVVDGSISNPADIRYSHNIVHDIKNSTIHDATAADAFGLECGPGDCRISNNIVYDIENKSTLTDAEARGIVVTDDSSWVYNNTVYDITNSGGTDYARGIYRSSGTATVTNNAVFDVDNTTNTNEQCFSGTMTQSSNVSSDATGTITNKTDYSNYFQNITDGTENLHLKEDSNSLWGSYGTDLDEDANLPITEDIDGDARDASAPEIGADENGADCGYTYKRKITIDGDKVGGSSGYLADFPLLVDLSDTWLKTAPTGDIQHANGWDIIFRGLDATTCNGTAPCNLDFEVETYDGSAGKLVAWVRVPQVYAGDNDPDNDSVIYMHYGNSCVTDDPQNATDAMR